MKTSTWTVAFLLATLALWRQLPSLAVTPVGDPKQPAPTEKAEAFVNGITADPATPSALRHGALKKVSVEPRSIQGYGISWEFIEYCFVKAPGSHVKLPGKASVSVFPDGEHAEEIIYPEPSLEQDPPEPDWDEVTRTWDAFVLRHWPGCRRSESWQESMKSFLGGVGSFRLTYCAKKDNVVQALVDIEISLLNGQLMSVHTVNFRSVLKKAKLALAPPHEVVLNAILRKDAEDEEIEPLKDVHINYEGREYLLGRPGRGSWGFRYVMELTGRRTDGVLEKVWGQYDENTKAAAVNNVQRYGPGDSYRPETQVTDAFPSWSPDGKRIYFSTTREVKGRLWWRRDLADNSLAVADVGEKVLENITLLRPIRPREDNFKDYFSSHESPIDGSVAVNINSGVGPLSLIDFHRQAVYLPSKRVHSYHPVQNGLNHKKFVSEISWKNSGFQWLPRGDGLVISLYKESDTNIYAVRWSPLKPLNDATLIPVVTDAGADFLPCIGDGGRRLAWGHQVPELNEKREADGNPVNQAIPHGEWAFEVADFHEDALTTPFLARKKDRKLYPTLAIAQLNSPNRRYLQLPGQPLDVNWDVNRKCWLVTTDEGMLWVWDTAGKLTAEPVATLRWNNKILLPRGTAHSPLGGRILVSAELDAPQDFPESALELFSTLFWWDGKSTQVTPALQVDVNNLPLRKFNGGNTPWAKILGSPGDWGISATP